MTEFQTKTESEEKNNHICMYVCSTGLFGAVICTTITTRRQHPRGCICSAQPNVKEEIANEKVKDHHDEIMELHAKHPARP